MTLLRFIFPFLFVRNWHDGTWELSKIRCVFFCGMIAFIVLGVIVASILHMPVVYTAPLQ
jgi:hypothetical protein